MSQAPTFSAELHKLCGKLREGDITQAEAQRLNEMLRKSRGARRFYRTFMALASALESRTMVQASVDQDADADQNIAVLFELLRMEQEAEVIELPPAPQPTGLDKSRPAGEQSLGWYEIADASRYLLSHAVKSVPAKWAAAAALLLVATLAVVLIAPNNTTSPTATNTRDSTGIDQRPRPRAPWPAVATLTNTHNATWAEQPAERALAPGSKLRANDRLTLTAGFAEITTNRGAIAILEAPATIELSHNKNALYLEAGKLVGICKTESSKGFIVGTPHMDVIDLGTRFGVDLTDDRQTQVHVLDGDVALTRQTLDGQIVLDANLSAGQAAAYRPEKGLAQVDFEADLFVADMREASLRPDFAGTNAAWFGQLSGDLRQDKRKADALQVFLERHDFILPEDAEVDFDREHAWKPQLGTGGHSVPAGERVDVYLLHFDLIDGHLKPEDFILDFGRPILGVIVSQATLDTTDGLFGLPSVTYPAFELDQRFLTGGHRGLNYRVDDDTDAEHALARKNDLASISPDGTRLKLRLWGGEPQRIARMDQVRVLVRSDRDRADSNNTGPVGLPTN